ncbi:MAG: histidine--tRNA ligase [Chloroherpetonaceae bacterium]|nr:histidine--tRNA ligase [Chloroherpetonaceae bacterium]
MSKLKSIKGTKDVFAPEIYRWQFAEKTIRDVFDTFGYQEIRTPVFEDTSLFARGIGETTDIVGKEMYSFQPDPNNHDSLTLRPEMTAGVMRAAIEHNFLGHSPTQKFYYFSELFRKERPQAGRQRQFWQFGAECLGSTEPEADAEIVSLMMTIYQRFGLKNFSLRINSLGNTETRITYRNILQEYFKPFESMLDDVSKVRLEKNPLRILDSKNPDLTHLIQSAPKITDYLDSLSKEHFNLFKGYLEAFGIAFVEDFTLVRGLDYYSRTAFELSSTDLGSQDALGGGGRYDGLSTVLGSEKEIPAVGFASGVERLLIALEKNGRFPSDLTKRVDVFLVAQSESARPWVVKTTNFLRQQNIFAETDLLKRSLKAQFREASRIGAKYALIVGEKELNENIFQFKNLATSNQEALTFEAIYEKLKLA